MKMKAAQRRWQKVRKGEQKADNFFTGAVTAPVFRAPGVILGDQSGAAGAHQSLGKVQKKHPLDKIQAKASSSRPLCDSSTF